VYICAYVQKQQLRYVGAYICTCIYMICTCVPMYIYTEVYSWVHMCIYTEAATQVCWCVYIHDMFVRSRVRHLEICVKKCRALSSFVRSFTAVTICS